MCFQWKLNVIYYLQKIAFTGLHLIAQHITRFKFKEKVKVKHMHTAISNFPLHSKPVHGGLTEHERFRCSRSVIRSVTFFHAWHSRAYGIGSLTPKQKLYHSLVIYSFSSTIMHTQSVNLNLRQKILGIVDKTRVIKQLLQVK